MGFVPLCSRQNNSDSRSPFSRMLNPTMRIIPISQAVEHRKMRFSRSKTTELLFISGGVDKLKFSRSGP